MWKADYSSAEKKKVCPLWVFQNGLQTFQHTRCLQPSFRRTKSEGKRSESELQTLSLIKSLILSSQTVHVSSFMIQISVNFQHVVWLLCINLWGLAAQECSSLSVWCWAAEIEIVKHRSHISAPKSSLGLHMETVNLYWSHSHMPGSMFPLIDFMFQTNTWEEEAWGVINYT